MEARPKLAYELGRLACKEGQPVEPIPPDIFNKKRFRDGWLDQHFGQKWEPKDELIPNRIWPMPL